MPPPAPPINSTNTHDNAVPRNITPNSTPLPPSTATATKCQASSIKLTSNKIKKPNHYDYEKVKRQEVKKEAKEQRTSDAAKIRKVTYQQQLHYWRSKGITY